MHAQGTHEVALHEPEGFGEQERVRDLARDPIDHLAPELFGHRLVELRLGETVLGARGDRPPLPGSGYQSRFSGAEGRRRRC